MATRTYRDGNAEVELDGALDALADALMSGAPGVVVRAMEAEAEAILADALATWPVKSGKSRDGFQIRTRFDERGVEVALINTAPHAYKIKFSKYTEAELKAGATTARQRAFLRRRHGQGAPADGLTMRSVWSERIRKPATRSEKKLAEDIGPQLTDLANGG